MSIPQGSIDPNVKIPNAIKALASKADAAFNSAYNPEAGETPDTEAVVDDNPPVLENREPAPKAEPVTPRGNDDDQSWEHRYKSMKGRYDRSESQIRNMSDQILSLQNILSTMEAAPTAARSETSFERFITPEEENDYGSDFLNVVGKRAKEEMLPLVKGYEQKIAELEAKLVGVNGYVEQDAKSRMESSLDERVPDWRDVNFDPNFISWLKLPDPYSGAIRHELLKAAYSRNDTPRVLAFFNGFLAEEAAVDPAKGETGRRNTPAKPSLENFAAPGRAKTAAASGAPAEKPNFTRAQIAKFYADSAAGKFRGKEAEKDRIEAQIFDAEREGRIK